MNQELVNQYWKNLSIKKLAFATVALSFSLAACGSDARAQEMDEKVLHCASGQGRKAVCDTGGHIFSARVERKVSSAPCTEGRSWGIDGTALWVSQGCRADFRVVTTSFQVPFETVACSSGRMRLTTCEVPAMFITDISLLRQDSSSPCILGRTFGFSEHHIWVDKGCRGLFKVYGMSGLPPIGGDFGGDGFGESF